MADNRHPPNRLLAWDRLQRGWSYEELASRIRAALHEAGESDTGITANTVRRWETGDRWPDPRFRKHLVTIFGKPASDLGLLTPEELATKPVTDPADVLEKLRMTTLKEMIGDDMDRATFLRRLLGAGALPILSGVIDLESFDRLAPDLDRKATDKASADAYAAIVTAQRSLYWTSPATDLLETAYANTRLGIHLLRGASAQDVRQRVSAAL